MPCYHRSSGSNSLPPPHAAQESSTLRTWPSSTGNFLVMNYSFSTWWSFEVIQLTCSLIKCLSDLLFTQSFSVMISEEV